MLLIKETKIIDKQSPRNGALLDLLIDDSGKIVEIGENLSNPTAQILEGENLHTSIGWMDVGARVGDPGLEHLEDVESLTKAAAAGGFTAVATLPNTKPVVDSKSNVNYLIQQATKTSVDIHPIGAVTTGCNSHNLAELYDMKTAGALAFSDGLNTIQHSGVMMRALLYAKSFDGLIMNHPLDKDMAQGGQINEGLMSTSLGMRGIPHIAEELLAQRDIYLLEYTDSRLHLLNLSSAHSVSLVEKAKKKGLSVSASVPVMNLYFTDADLADFDTNLKVWPPLRGQLDKEALIEGVKNGVIELLNSNHQAQNDEGKDLEFAYAEYGAIGLETAFAAAWTILEDHISIEKMLELFTLNPRTILGLVKPEIELGAMANLTVFDPSETWTFAEKDIHSKSSNSPFIGHKLKGKVKATIHKGQITIL